MAWLVKASNHECQRPELYSKVNGMTMWELASVGDVWQCDECALIWKVKRGLASHDLYWEPIPVYTRTHGSSLPNGTLSH